MGYQNGAFVDQMINGHRDVTEKTVTKIHEISGCAGWFEVPEKRGRKVPKLSLVPPSPTDDVHVPVLANAASMGPGASALAVDVVTGGITLAARWVQEQLRPSAPDALRFISGYGDSMSPTFSSGDMLLVDTGVREVGVGGIFVLKAHDQMFVKRVSLRMNGSFEVSSDNPVHKTVDVLDGSAQVDIIGRVVWVWNGKKL